MPRLLRVLLRWPERAHYRIELIESTPVRPVGMIPIPNNRDLLGCINSALVFQPCDQRGKFFSREKMSARHGMYLIMLAVHDAVASFHKIGLDRLAEFNRDHLVL